MSFGKQYKGILLGVHSLRKKLYNLNTEPKTDFIKLLALSDFLSFMYPFTEVHQMSN